jgi:hypothetical protein
MEAAKAQEELLLKALECHGGSQFQAKEIYVKKENEIRSRRRRIALASLAGSMMLVSQATHASGMPVIDIPGLINAVQNFFATAGQYEKEIKEWERKAKDTKIGGSLNFTIPGVPSQLDFQKVPEDYMLRQACGKKALGMSLDTNPFSFNADSGDYDRQHLQLCVNIQRIRNKKFNETVDFAQQTLRGAENVLLAISAKRNQGNSRGNVQSASSDAERFNADLRLKTARWETNMKSYDTYIEMMQIYQGQVAKAALDGDTLKKAIGVGLRNELLKMKLGVDD